MSNYYIEYRGKKAEHAGAGELKQAVDEDQLNQAGDPLCEAGPATLTVLIADNPSKCLPL
ncbi:MAG: hypothetical protein WBX38_10500 [Candidatus Sulfotelmatobacter sp.]